MSLNDDLIVFSAQKQNADRVLGRVEDRPVDNPSELSRSGVIDPSTVPGAGVGPNAAAGVGTGSVPSYDDIKLKGYMGAFEKLIPKTSYEDDIRRQEKMQLFNFLANIGRVGMQGIASSKGVRQFSPIVDDTAKNQERIEQFRMLQRQADDKRNNVILSMAMQQKKDDDAQKARQDALAFQREQLAYQKEKDDKLMAFNRERADAQDARAAAQDALTKQNMEAQQKYNSGRLAIEWSNTKRLNDKYNRENQPMSLFSTEFGDVKLKNPADAQALVFAMLRKLEDSGDKEAASAADNMAQAIIDAKNGGKPSQYDKNSYQYAYSLVNRKLKDNPDAVQYLFELLNKDSYLEQNDAQKKKYKSYLEAKSAKEKAEADRLEAERIAAEKAEAERRARIESGGNGRRGNSSGNSGGNSGTIWEQMGANNGTSTSGSIWDDFPNK